MAIQEILGQGRGEREIIFQHGQDQYRVFDPFNLSGKGMKVSAGGAQYENVVDPSSLPPEVWAEIQGTLQKRQAAFKAAGLSDAETAALARSSTAVGYNFRDEAKKRLGITTADDQLAYTENRDVEELADQLAKENQTARKSALSKLTAKDPALAQYATAYLEPYSNLKSATGRAWGGGKGPLAQFAAFVAGGAALSAGAAGTTAAAATGTNAAAPIVEIGGGVAGAGSTTSSLGATLVGAGKAVMGNEALKTGAGLALDYLSSRKQGKAAERAAEVGREAADQMRADLAGYRGTGDLARGKLEQMLGLTAAGGDIGAELEKTPGYQFQVQQAEKAIRRTASAAGYRGSGRLYDELMRSASGLASQRFDTHMEQLFRQSEQGRMAAAGSAEAIRYGSEATQAGIIGKAGAQSQLYGSIASAIGTSASDRYLDKLKSLVGD